MGQRRDSQRTIVEKSGRCVRPLKRWKRASGVFLVLAKSWCWCRTRKGVLRTIKPSKKNNTRGVREKRRKKRERGRRLRRTNNQIKKRKGK